MNKKEWKAKYGLWRSIMRIPGYDETQNVWSERFEILYSLLETKAPECLYSMNKGSHDHPFCLKDHRTAAKYNMNLNREACEGIRLHGWDKS